MNEVISSREKGMILFFRERNRRRLSGVEGLPSVLMGGKGNLPESAEEHEEFSQRKKGKGEST